MGTKNFWEDNDLEQKIVDVLADVTYAKPDHHFGRPFVTAYQLAILFRERYPEEIRTVWAPRWGKGFRCAV